MFVPDKAHEEDYMANKGHRNYNNKILFSEFLTTGSRVDVMESVFLQNMVDRYANLCE